MNRLQRGFAFNSVINRNIRVKGLSEILIRGGRFLLVAAAARLLSVDQFGVYMFAFAFGNILANVSDFGLQMYLTREVARARDPELDVLGRVVRAKSRLVLAVLALLVLVAIFYPRPGSVRIVLLLGGLTALAQSWNELWNYFFRGLQRLADEAALNLLQMVLGTGLGCLALFLGWGPRGLFLGLLFAAIVTSLVAILKIRRMRDAASQGEIEHEVETEVATSPKAVSGESPTAAILSAAPVGIAILLSILYFRIDILFLERMHGDIEVGAYSAAYRIIEALLFVPAVFLAAIYPAFSQVADARGPELRKIHDSSIRWMLLISIAVVALLLLAAPVAIQILYGDRYESSAEVLRILAPALVFVFVNYALTHFLVALQGQKWNAVFSGVCLLVNIVLNAIFVPRYGAVGAAATTVVTEATLLALCAFAVQMRMKDTRDRGNGSE